MHALNWTRPLLTLAVLGGVAGAIMTSSLQVKSGAHGSIAHGTRELTAVPTRPQARYASPWQTLKCKSEAQISDNDKRIRMFIAQRAKASKTFRATYDMRVAELERRNIALRSKLNDYKGDRGEKWAESE